MVTPREQGVARLARAQDGLHRRAVTVDEVQVRGGEPTRQQQTDVLLKHHRDLGVRLKGQPQQSEVQHSMAGAAGDKEGAP